MIPASPRSAFKPQLLPSASQRSLSITAESHPATGENGHCFLCRRNGPLWTTLSGLREEVAFWHILLSVAAPRSKWFQSSHEDRFWLMVSIFPCGYSGVGHSKLYGSLRMNTRSWWMDSRCLARCGSSVTQISSGEKVAQECLGCPLVVGSRTFIRNENSVSSSFCQSWQSSLKRISQLINIIKRSGFCAVTRPTVVNKQCSRRFSPRYSY